ncbi:hypothetical protein MIND_00555200 [Mycena indigotica]|uniref:DUF6534 domain-containing protein n=1 Tax=Mycena indigotica TaxID=2126181 RepID=A0A8H6T172_9AGAR|nr:uncharacterized protein MIND_00555200 [Mycena indigotica]KAF7307600.1 hypothetical protein MIND_00555200 [Mycena indigotica]
MVDAVVVFTINDGFLTCAIVFAAITCVLRLPGTFVWIGIHFNIAKLYSNSILATLNLRNWYRHRHRPLGIPLNGRHNQPLRAVPRSIISQDKPSITGSDNLTRPNMEVFIDHQVEYNVAVRCAADDCVDIKNELRSSIRSASMDETHLVV